MEEDVNSVNLFVSVNNTVWPVFLERSKMDLARVQQSRRLPFNGFYMDSFNLHRRHVINNRHHQDREEFCTVVTAQLNLSRRNPLFIEHCRPALYLDMILEEILQDIV
ncbi:hypothetical protein V1477_015294 [Vespula maculifrons]|uniref:Uncharacterized protein n=1 Tax=Vespula maculifrons TaxID=7453 RepID=A0ABD2BL15_VESMC